MVNCLKKLLGSKKNRNNNINKDNTKEYVIKKSLEENIELFKNNIFRGDNTIIYRQLKNKNSQLKFCLIFIDGMVNTKIINENILYQLMNTSIKLKDKNLIKYIKEEVLIVNEVTETNSIKEVLSSLLIGKSILLVDGLDRALILNTMQWEKRSIEEPQGETIVKGPREGFNESLITNLSLIRRRINSSELKFHFKEMGVRTKTKICIAYMDGIVNKKILNELEDRLNKIDIEGFFSTGTIQEFIKDNPLSPFNTIGNTERPDVVASKLLQGRIALLCEGSPTVLTLPYLFIEHFQVNEDYYDNFLYASINRFLRIIAFILTITIPAIYVAFVTFHKEMIPIKLAFSIYLAREGVPLPTAIKTFGIPYMLKLIDLEKYNIVDSTIRAPWWLLKYRTKFISKDRIRLKDYVKRRKSNESN